MPLQFESHNLAVLGSTGSIGTNTLDVVRSSQKQLRPLALSAHSRLDLLVEQAEEFRPRWIVATDEDKAKRFHWKELAGIELLIGPDGLSDVASSDEVDTVVAAIVGRAGLESTLRAVECGKRIALANKETLVVAGTLVGALAKQTNATLLPVDSEHSAIFQALQAGQSKEIQRLILTASGGPFRNHSAEQLKQVTVEQALNHPTWNMGPKITVDSATMMNKALEIIEAKWLFDIEVDQIDVVIHPQSIVHSMVEFVDGSVIGQMSPPDMRLPIQYALTYPNRANSPAEKLDFSEAMQWEFMPPDEERFPALALGKEVARLGGTAGAVVNAANEAAVAEFLNGNIRFTDIVVACRKILESHHYEPAPTLSRLLELDRWARKEIKKWISC